MIDEIRLDETVEMLQWKTLVELIRMVQQAPQCILTVLTVVAQVMIRCVLQ